MKTRQVPPVGRVLGLQLLPLGQDPANHRVVVQYTSPKQPKTANCLEMPLLDALYLLNLLEAMSADNRLDHLRRPPSTPAH